jgi:hypothetical protein
MALDSISQLGQTIGSLSNTQSEIKQSLTPDEANPQFNFGFSDKVKINGSGTISKLIYSTSSFIIDHPVQGEIDSPIYLIDGGYEQESGNSFPLTFDIIFTETTDKREVLYTFSY